MHAPTATAARGLDHDGIADLFRCLESAVKSPKGLGRARKDGKAGSRHGAAGFHLVRHLGDHLWGRADEGEVVALTHLGEISILGQKPVPGMHRLAILDEGCANHAWNVEIAATGRPRTHANSVVRELN